MEPCSFCGSQLPFGTGKMYVKKDAKILYFCSRRCEKNMLKLKRSPRNVGFTAAAKFAKKQHMATLSHEHKAADAPKADAPAKKAAKPAAKKAAKPAKKE